MGCETDIETCRGTSRRQASNLLRMQRLLRMRSTDNRLAPARGHVVVAVVW